MNAEDTRAIAGVDAWARQFASLEKHMPDINFKELAFSLAPLDLYLQIENMCGPNFWPCVRSTVFIEDFFTSPYCPSHFKDHNNQATREATCLFEYLLASNWCLRNFSKLSKCNFSKLSKSARAPTMNAFRLDESILMWQMNCMWTAWGRIKTFGPQTSSDECLKAFMEGAFIQQQ